MTQSEKTDDSVNCVLAFLVFGVVVLFLWLKGPWSAENKTPLTISDLRRYDSIEVESWDDELGVMKLNNNGWIRLDRTVYSAVKLSCMHSGTWGRYIIIDCQKAQERIRQGMTSSGDMEEEK